MARLEQFAKDYKVEVVNVIDVVRGLLMKIGNPLFNRLYFRK